MTQYQAERLRPSPLPGARQEPPSANGQGRETRPDPLRPRAPARWGLGILCPTVLALWAIVDVTLRLLPMDWLALKPSNAARRMAGRYSPFAANLRMRSDSHVGDLALLGNLPPDETRAPITFTTDSRGFRVTGAPTGPSPPRVLLMEGDSFTFGGALSDEETLSAELSRRLRTSVYNGGRFFSDEEGPRELDWLLGQLGSPRLTVLYVHLERFDLHPDSLRGRPGTLGRAARGLLGEERYGGIREAVAHASRTAHTWLDLSPLRTLATRAYRSLANGRLAPNEQAHLVSSYRLPDGRRMLLSRTDVERYSNPPGPEDTRETADHLKLLADEMERRGLDFRVLLVPEKATIYAPYLRGEPELRRPEGPPYLERLQRELERRGLRVINAQPALERLAGPSLGWDTLLYYRDDSHWTPRGVKVASNAAARGLLQSGWRP